MSLIRRAKVAFLALLGIALLGAPLHAAGTIPLALAIQLDTNGNVAANCRATFLQAGTVAAKQNVYADFSLTQPLSNPLSCDQAGRLPMFWLADGLIHVRLTTSAGAPIVDTTMQVLGPSSGGGGGSTVDPTSIMQTGDIKLRWGLGPLSGFVRANGLTIGNATSGATERANADTQALFIYLYTYTILPVSGGRTGNALNDYNAGKTIVLPDWRGRAIAGMDDMGNSPAGNLTFSIYGGDATILGTPGGFQTQTLATANLPPYTPSGSVATSVAAAEANAIGIQNPPINPQNIAGIGGTSSGGSITKPPSFSALSTFAGTPQGGSSTPFSVIQPTRVLTVYMKL